jgi:hypothetical protein
MYRACSTWQYEVVVHLVEQHFSGERLGYVTGESYAEMHVPAANVRNLQRPWRVLKSHEGHRSFARALESGAALAVYVYRDIREVALSLKHKRSTTFEELVRSGMIHQILANDRFWRARPRVLVQRYEALIADPATAVVQLGRHLGLGVTRREGAEIADEYSLTANRRRIENLRKRLLAAGIDLDDPGNGQICDPITLLHWNHLRTGRKSSWETEATPQQHAQIERLCGSWLEAHGYQLPETKAGPVRSIPTHAPLRARGELDLALGRCSSWLRKAGSCCPNSARVIKRLLGLREDVPRRPLVWPAGELCSDTSEPDRKIAALAHEYGCFSSHPVEAL